MRATIYKSTGSWYLAKADDGKFYNARMKGIFKIDEITSTNPVAVGDEVEIEPEADEGNAMIAFLPERRNYIARTSPHQHRERHIVASNLDQALLFATLKEPRTSQGFIDRFLVACEAYHVPAIIIFNKADIYRNKELELFETFRNIYSAIGYTVLLCSMKSGENVQALANLLTNKTTLLFGHSGVGKSTFINSIFPEKDLKTQDVSGWSGKGKHTTTFAEMFDLPFGGKIIDTPGIREFGITDISKQELSHYFPEMRNALANCQFNNCIHINEPGCAVKEEVEKGNISEERYRSYCNILDTIEEIRY